MVWAGQAYVNNLTDLHLLCINVLNNFSPKRRELQIFVFALNTYWFGLIERKKSYFIVGGKKISGSIINN